MPDRTQTIAYPAPGSRPSRRDPEPLAPHVIVLFGATGDLTRPMLTVDVADIDAVWKTIESFGGERVGEKLPVGDMGFAGYFKDPEGNILGLWQSA